MERNSGKSSAGSEKGNEDNNRTNESNNSNSSISVFRWLMQPVQLRVPSIFGGSSSRSTTNGAASRPPPSSSTRIPPAAVRRPAAGGTVPEASTSSGITPAPAPSASSSTTSTSSSTRGEKRTREDEDDDNELEQPRSRHRGDDTNSAPTDPPARAPEVVCRVCLDSSEEIRKDGKQLMTTTCGHVFCDVCIRDAVRKNHKCPACIKRLPGKSSYRPLFI